MRERCVDMWTQDLRGLKCGITVQVSTICPKLTNGCKAKLRNAHVGNFKSIGRLPHIELCIYHFFVSIRNAHEMKSCYFA